MGPKTEERYIHKSIEREKRRAKRQYERRCRDLRRRIGGCVFVLGLPLLIAGGIILIVSHTNNKNSIPSSLFIVGPLLTCLSALCFIIGALLTELINITRLIDCLIPGNPDTCPVMFKLFIGNNQTYIDQQAALRALQAVPHKSALRKPPNLEGKDEYKARRGVTFSGSNTALLSNTLTSSVQPDYHIDQGKPSLHSSIVSLRNCKIYPEHFDNDTLHTDTIYTVGQCYHDVPVSTKSNDDVFDQSEHVI